MDTWPGRLDLHPMRPCWKQCWENRRLATAERQLPGVVRENDLPNPNRPPLG